MTKYRKHTAEFKAQIVLEMLSGEKSVAQISREHRIKDSLLYRWKAEFLERVPEVFASGADKEKVRLQDQVAELERLVGRLTMQLEIAKKASHYLKSTPDANGR
jgi:transposase-like protein